MKEYLTYIYDRKPDWSVVPEAAIGCFQWEDKKKYRPPAVAKMCIVRNGGIYVLLETEEKSPLTVCEKTNAPVYEDSCLEVFLKLGEEGYINIETNSKGVYLSQFGQKRQGRVFLNEITPIEPVISPFNTNNSWGNEIYISEELIAALYKNGCPSEFYGNFYKCGDKTEIPHYGSYAPMEGIDLGFHNPDCFAKISVKEWINQNG